MICKSVFATDPETRLVILGEITNHVSGIYCKTAIYVSLIR